MALEKEETRYGITVSYWRIASIPGNFETYRGDIILKGYASRDDALQSFHAGSPPWATRRLPVTSAAYQTVMADEEAGLDTLRTLIYDYITTGYTRADGTVMQWTDRDGNPSWFANASDVIES